jgi:hypothetical protein
VKKLALAFQFGFKFPVGGRVPVIFTSMVHTNGHPDILPKADTLPKDISSNGHFDERTIQLKIEMLFRHKILITLSLHVRKI